MIIQCSMCGKEVEITPLHKDYERLSKGQSSTYICEKCSFLVTQSAKKQLKKE